MPNPIIAPNVGLPRSLDVNVQVSKPQAEQTTDLSVAVFAQAGFGASSFGFGADRVAFFSTYDAAAADPRVSAEGKKAARDFFAQSPRAKTLAIGQVFTAAQKGFLKTGALGATLAAFQAVTTGTFAVAIDGVNANLTAINFSGAATLANIASILQTKIQAVGTGGFTAATVALVGSQIIITSGTSGNLSSVSVLAPVSPASGVDISGPNFLNGRLGVGVAQPGYLPTTLDVELGYIATAARASGKFVYGWALDVAYRDTAAQLLAGAWAQARTAYMPLVSNSPLAYDPSSVNDLAPTTVTAGQYRVTPLYHDKPDYYPDVSLLAGMLAVNYAQADSTRTAKFLDLPGIPTATVDETQWAVLEGKGYNTLTLTGNDARVFREGGTGSPSWYIDDLINLDNFKEEIQVAVYNVFLRNKKVPYTLKGQQLIVAAVRPICKRYVLNGALSSRPVEDPTSTTGERIDPAFTILPSPIALQSVSDRQARIAPPMVINVNLAGAFHSIAINVNAYS